MKTEAKDRGPKDMKGKAKYTDVSIDHVFFSKKSSLPFVVAQLDTRTLGNAKCPEIC